ncbi:MAG: hypothetical protein ABW048_02525 [Sphingobium sp.]
MNLASLLDALPPRPIDGLAFPRNLLGAFRRKSISFCTGVTDEKTIVYWIQSRTFSIDLRLTEGGDTPVADRQGWVGDTLWDDTTRQLSWQIARSYQPRNQWPEPAGLSFIGNCVLEFAPSGAYVEDWRQQSSRGPFLGLRLTAMIDETTGDKVAMAGGLVIAGENLACARSRPPRIDDALQSVIGLKEALAAGVATEAEVESYEVSVAVGSHRITHSTQPRRQGEMIGAGDFSIRPDGTVAEAKLIDGNPCTLLYDVDMFEPHFTFDIQTPSTSEALDWMEQEKCHLSRHAVLVS